jgi:hypothetical protein
MRLPVSIGRQCGRCASKYQSLALDAAIRRILFIERRLGAGLNVTAIILESCVGAASGLQRDLPAHEVAVVLGRIIIATALLVSGRPVGAAPPPPGSKAGEKLIPYADAIRGLAQPGSGRACCDLSDCRVVDIRIGRNGRYEALISAYDPETGEGFPAGPNRFLEVPPEVVLPPDKRNGLPVAVACWVNWSHNTNGFLCLVPGPGS